MLLTAVVCHHCSGTGKIIREKCNIAVEGSVTKRRTIAVKIPPGVDDGQQIRISGQGEPGINGGPGDLYIVFRVEQHELFERDGDDIYCEMPINICSSCTRRRN